MVKKPVGNRIRPAAVMLGLLFCIVGCRDQGGISDRKTRGFENMTASTAQGGKDLTLLHGDPHRQTDSLPDRISRLQREIARGEAVYTREELALLERKLAEAEDQLRVIQHP